MATAQVCWVNCACDLELLKIYYQYEIAIRSLTQCYSLNFKSSSNFVFHCAVWSMFVNKLKRHCFN